MDEIKIVERPLQEVMEHAITLEESERRLTEMIHNYYHEDKVEKITYDENYVAMVREAENIKIAKKKGAKLCQQQYR